MSAPPSPRPAQVASSKAQAKRRDRPPALELAEPKAVSDGDTRYGAVGTRKQQPRLHVSSVNDNSIATEPEQPRSASATSSLDPYYFGVHTPADSPPPRVPDLPFFNKTPEPSPAPHNEPTTPVRNPAAIDRKGLVGVGELATPRWARPGRVPPDERADSPELQGHLEEQYSIISGEGPEHEDEPGSPWTIEAIDGELDELEEIKPFSRAIRPRRSMAEESGGEEILYPRNPLASDTPRASKGTENAEHAPEQAVATATSSPPSAFQTNSHRAKKRSSDEYEMDQSGDVLSKSTRSSVSSVSKDKTKDEKVSVRRHKSLGVALPPSGGRDRDKARERRRESASINLGSTPKASAANRESVSSKPAKHTRHTSASSSSSNLAESHHSRRAHTTDFSHLPPSPSSSSIQQFIKRSSSRDLTAHASPNVAHSLLRGTQEGWSGLDDETTAEALRKLDGLTGKSARARSSVSVGRPGSSSRPGTPGMAKNGTQWEGISSSESNKSAKRSSARDSTALRDKEKDRLSGINRHALSPGHGGGEAATDAGEGSGSHDEKLASPASSDKLAKRSSVRSTLNFTTPKRASASSTTYTSTPDSASLSATTSITSVSATSGRFSTSKLKRNSASSDVSSIHSGEAVASNGEGGEEEHVPPVPPLPKDLNQFKTPPLSSQSAVFPPVGGIDEKLEDDNYVAADTEDYTTDNLEIPQATAIPMKPPPVIRQDSLNSQGGYVSSDSAPAVQKTPSKKWSFSHALNIRLSGSPSSSSVQSPAKTPAFSVSPRSATFGSQLRKSSSKDQPLSPSKGSAETWSPIHPDAMASASSLASLSSVGSLQIPNSPSSSVPPILGYGMREHSRPGTPSSGGTNQTMNVPQTAPLSPSSSIRRGTSSKRLTPSSIPFFRRSSSQSMQIPNQPGLPSSVSPTLPSDPPTTSTLSGKNSDSPTTTKDALLSPTTPHKKSSIMSLGSLLKGSSSRKSLQDKSDPKSGKETARASDKEKSKKDDKDRSESRISVLMGRKRGKTLSSTDPKKAKPVVLPPMQMSALPASTAQRVANLKANSSSSSSSTGPTTRSSRATSQTVSSMQKQSDASLRSSRNQLPTIAGSPSVGTVSSQASKEPKDHPPSSLINSVSGLPKETPTKIPRIASRSSTTAGSPSLKNNGSILPPSRRASVHAATFGTSSADPSPVPDGSMNEFGVMDNTSEFDLSKSSSQIVAPKASVRASPSRVPRHSSTSGAGTSSSRKPNRESISFSGLRKSSTASVASISSSAAPSSESNHHRFSALSPSKGLKLLSPKMSLPTARSNNTTTTHNIHQTMASPSASRLSLSTPSPVPSSVDDEELAGDEEMLNYIKRQQAKKMAAGATQDELDDMLRFPEPIRPTTPLSPNSLLRSSQAQWLSEYERKEVQDYPSVYFYGARSEKKPATPSNPTNNYGYDDDRGDYLVVNGDHLGYRYEVIDTLGKGSFGQVLRCRDHCTGESVAIKIIRNKKRFHHQALVEIKILDNLIKWDPEEKHHVIKMTEHFYFRNHLCIAMELLSINLYELIKANGFVGFTTALIRRFTSQMLLSLSLMRSHRVVHCDLKPENVLLKHPAKSAIKVIDFGSSCFEHEKIFTYIQSRFYRSPEVILGMNYHMAIDMWSLGCILAELYTGFPIFPGENEQEQLSCIMEVLGVPDKDFVNRSSRKRIFFDSTGAPRPVVNSKGRRRRPGTKTLAQVLRCDDELFVDFIAKCLVWDPEKRMKPQAASRHPFITSGRRPKITNPSPGTAKALLASATNLSSSRNKPTDTPKKSQISAPTPLTARVSRTNTTGVPNTPNSSSSHATLGSSTRGYRASQSQTFSSYHLSRTNGFATTK